MRSTTLLWLFLIALVILVLGYDRLYRGRLDGLLDHRSDIVHSQSLESFSGARSDEVVTDAPALRAIVHVVKFGDSWSSIAAKYGIADYNELKAHFGHVPLTVGMKLDIPAELRGQP